MSSEHDISFFATPSGAVVTLYLFVYSVSPMRSGTPRGSSPASVFDLGSPLNLQHLPQCTVGVQQIAVGVWKREKGGKTKKDGGRGRKRRAREMKRCSQLWEGVQMEGKQVC